jgi:ATP-dependent Clp protease ATP-binding subunit ClpA
VVSFKNAIIIMTSNVGSQFIREFSLRGSEAFSAFNPALVSDKGDLAASFSAGGGVKGMVDGMMGEITERLEGGLPDILGSRDHKAPGPEHLDGRSGDWPVDAQVGEAADARRLENAIDEALRATFRPEFLNRIDDIIVFEALGLDDIDRIVGLQLAEVSKRLADKRIEVELAPAVAEQLAIDGFDPVYGARPLKRLIQRSVVDLLANALVAGEIGEGDALSIELTDDMSGYRLKKH